VVKGVREGGGEKRGKSWGREEELSVRRRRRFVLTTTALGVVGVGGDDRGVVVVVAAVRVHAIPVVRKTASPPRIIVIPCTTCG